MALDLAAMIANQQRDLPIRILYEKDRMTFAASDFLDGRRPVQVVDVDGNTVLFAKSIRLHGGLCAVTHGQTVVLDVISLGDSVYARRP